MSSDHQDLDLALSSPSITLKEGLSMLKLLSTIFDQIFIFNQMIAFQKL